MGFYAPAQIVRDAREHGVTVRPPDVNYSHWDCTIEKTSEGLDALRLGLRQIKGFRKELAKRLVTAREHGNGRPFLISMILPDVVSFPEMHCNSSQKQIRLNLWAFPGEARFGPCKV